jgi:hypothetical protein
MFGPMDVEAPQQNSPQGIYYILKPIFIENIYADFFDKTQISLIIVLPIHFRLKSPSQKSEYDKILLNREPKFFFNCFKKE